MIPTIGYNAARWRMEKGYKVYEMPLLRGGYRALIQTADGVYQAYIRSDSWRKLRKECHCVDRLNIGRTHYRYAYLWELKNETEE